MKDFVGFKTQFAECIANTSEYTETKKRIVLMRCECGKEFKTSYVNLRPKSVISCGCRNKRGTKLPVAGERFGKLTYIAETIGTGSHGMALHAFKCDCGNTKNLELNSVFTGNTASCGCAFKVNGVAATNARYAGKKYNMLTFVRHAEKWASKNPGKCPIGVWMCGCGKEVEFRISDVRYGKTTCCGCATGRDGGQARIGNKHGNLTLIEILPKHKDNAFGRWLCDCGNTVDRLLVNVENSKSTPSCGCLMSSLLREKRGFTLDESVFETITDDSAYWLGFLLADGNVSENTITINLKTSDTHHLEKFRDFVGGNQLISVCKDPRVTRYSFGSIKISKDLAKWGIVPNKSLIAKPHEELKMNRHFWRGVVDGDGTLYKDKNGVGLCGTEAVCQGFLDFAKSLIPTKTNVRKCKANLWNVGISCGNMKNVSLLEALYIDAPTYLIRKHARAIAAVAEVHKGNGVNVEVGGVWYRTIASAAEKLSITTDEVKRRCGLLEPSKWQPITIAGVTYKTKTEAMKKLDIGFEKLSKVLSGASVEKLNYHPITLDGVTYRSESAACKALGIYPEMIRRYEKTGSFEGQDSRRKIRIGETVYESIKQAFRETGIPPNTLIRNAKTLDMYLVGLEYEGEMYPSYTKLAENLKLDRKKVKTILGDAIKVHELEIRYV